MLPQNHFLFGLVASFVLYFGFDVGIFGCFVFLLASVLIDVDHYLYYVWRKGDWSLGRAVLWGIERKRVLDKMNRVTRNKFYNHFVFLHGVESVILFGVLGYFIWDLFYLVGLGFLFHLILDWVDQISFMDRFDRVSCVYDYFKYRKLKSVGNRIISKD